jgi:hypothetical protein
MLLDPRISLLSEENMVSKENEERRSLTSPLKTLFYLHMWDAFGYENIPL